VLATTTTAMRERCREPVAAATSWQDAGVRNAARGQGRRNQAIEDDGIGWCDPVKYLICRAN
jgi:hypothetical protein